MWYRFRSRESGAAFHTIVDYGPKNTLDWTASDHEGSYQMELVVWNKQTGESAGAIAGFEFVSRVGADNAPVITPTANPLVYLYSAPACTAGMKMRVRFHLPEALAQSTPAKPCRAGVSMNFYIAGMRAQSEYTLHHVIENPKAAGRGPALTVSTPPISVAAPTYKVNHSPPARSGSGILLQSTLFSPPVATDLLGNVLWFYDGSISFLTAPLAGGRFLGISELPGVDPSDQFLREFNLAGTTIKETNAARVSEQLTAMGLNPITAFHHEARLLPDGKYLVLASTERILTDAQGPGPVDVLGDIILVLDADFQVIWAWDGFDHLDTHRPAILGETCVTFAGCAPYTLATNANDWLHGNSVRLTPDGNLLYSARSQDWVIKINYSNGSGNGDVIWRIGKDGDFQIVSNDPSPWFSHQHDAALEQTPDGLLLTVFDDGNTRQADDPAAHSRGQAYRIDEDRRIATAVLNADLGAYSYALGSAQLLPNGNYHFDVGWITNDPLGGRNTSRAVEVDPAGNVVYSIQMSIPEYRSFRMRDLYTAP